MKKEFPLANIIVNDFWELAIEVKAYGLHIGKEDFYALTLAQRKILVNSINLLKGTSSHNMEDIESLDATLWDYTGIGPIFPTSSKVTNYPFLGSDFLHLAFKKTKIPLVPIGGIDLDNFSSIYINEKIIPASISMLANESILVKIVDFIRKQAYYVRESKTI